MSKTTGLPTTNTLLEGIRAYLVRLKLSPVSRKLYLIDIHNFLSFLSGGSSEYISLDVLGDVRSYTRYIQELKKSASAESVIKRTIAGLKQLGTYLSLVYTIENPTTTLSFAAKNQISLSENLFEKYIKQFTKYLNSEHLSLLTIKSYKSDITRYLHWSSKELSSTEVIEVLKEKNIEKYLNHLTLSGSAIPSTIARKRQSLDRFTAWMTSEYATIAIPDSRNIDFPAYSSAKNEGIELTKTLNTEFSETRIDSSPEEKSFFVKIFNYRIMTLAILLIFMTTLSVFTYRQFNKNARLAAAYPSTPVTPNRQLSFQGRLENAAGTPITSATSLTFKLWNDVSSTNPVNELYTTSGCTITPDADGVFSTQIGNGTCGSAIPSTVFSENSNIWLEVTVVSDILTPRQPIASVAYALNAETLQGLPLGTSTSTVPYINASGVISLTNSSPSLTSTTGTFQISAPALNLVTTNNGSIGIAPNGTGVVNVTGSTVATTSFFNVSANQLTTGGTLIKGNANTDNTGFKLIDLFSGSTPTSKFSVTDAGLTTIGADLYVSSGISLFNDSVSDDTIEATKYCTGQEGVGTCVTDFSTFATGTNYWTRSNGNISPLTVNDTISATTSAATALTITQTGAFNALLVEDQASDSTPFIIDQSGNVGIGTTAPTSKLQVTGAVTGKALTIFNEAGDQNILTASASGTTVANVTRTGNLELLSSVASADRLTIAPKNSGSATFTGTITSADLTGDDTWTFPDATGTVCLSSGNCGSTGVSPNSLDFTEFKNAMALDANTTIASGGFTFAIASSDWAISTTGGLTGITDIANDGAYTQTGTSANTLSGDTTETKVNAAGGSANALTLSGTLGAFNGSDTFRGLYLNYTNANHTSTSNVFNGIDIAGITADVDATETAINIGAGWDNGLVVNGVTVVTGAGTLPSTALSGTIFTAAGDTGGGQAITTGNTLSILGGSNGIDTIDSATATVTLNLDTTEIGTTTFGSGSGIVWTFDASGGTDPTLTFGNNSTSVGGDLSISNNTYFAGGSLYYVASNGNAKFLDLIVADSGSPGLTVGDSSNAQIQIGDSTITDNNTTLTLDSSTNIIGFGANDTTLTASGLTTLTTAATLTMAATTTLNCSDCIDFDDMKDSLTLDADLTIDQGTNTWTQNFTGTTTTGLTYNANSLTTGSALATTSTGTAVTGDLGKFELTGNAGASLTGNALKVGITGTTASGNSTALNVTNGNTGSSAYVARFNDDGSYADTTPFVITGSGNVGIGTTGPLSKLSVGGVGDSSAAIYGVIVSGYGVNGNVTDGVGVYGISVNGFGLVGSSNGTGLNAGVQGINGSSGIGGYFSSSSGYALITDVGNVGIGSTGPDAKLDALATTEQLRLTYTDGSIYSSFTLNSGGDLTIAPTGGDIALTGDLAVNGATSADITSTTTTATIFNTTTTSLAIGAAATTALNFGNGSGNYTAINIGSSTGTHTINIAGTGATAADTINIGTGGTGADTINIGNNASTTAISLITGTGAFTLSNKKTTGNANTINWDSATTQTGGVNLLVVDTSALTPDNTNTVRGIVITAPFTNNTSVTQALTINGTNWDTDIALQNSASIDNHTSGVINLQTGAGGAGTGVQIDLQDTATTNGLCHSGGNIAATGVDRLIVACSNIPSDIAEFYETSGAPEAGDIVATSDQTISYTTKRFNAMTGQQTDEEIVNTTPILNLSNKTYQENLLGIVSTSPYQTFGRAINTVAKHPQPIALAGRVPVKISSINGTIKPGDKIVASDIPGVGMKSTKAGRIIGIALAHWDDTDPNNIGKIEVLLNNSWYDPDLTLNSSGDVTLQGTDQNTYAVATPTGITSKIGAFAEATIARLQAGFAKINELQVATISPLASGAPVTITGPVVIKGSELSGSSEPQEPILVVEGEIEAATISARVAKLNEIQADTITAKNIVADTISANHIEGLDAKLATLSATLSDDEVSTITDRIKARLDTLTGNLPTATDLPSPTEASSAGGLTPIDPTPTNIASSSATLSSLESDFVTINNYLAVIGQATITTLDVTALLNTNTLQSKDGLLALQPLGGIINLANNTLVVDSQGQVALNGNLNVTGTIALHPQTTSPLAELLSIYNEKGEAVATIDASGSANLADLTTGMITIASPAVASESGGLAQLIGTTKSNATAGVATLISPNTELTIESPYITANSLVYLTPTTNTDNKVLFVKSKGDKSFTVGIDTPAGSDISFNWWIIQLKP